MSTTKVPIAVTNDSRVASCYIEIPEKATAGDDGSIKARLVVQFSQPVERFDYHTLVSRELVEATLSPIPLSGLRLRSLQPIVDNVIPELDETEPKAAEEEPRGSGPMHGFTDREGVHHPAPGCNVILKGVE